MANIVRFFFNDCRTDTGEMFSQPIHRVSIYSLTGNKDAWGWTVRYFSSFS